MTKHPESDFSVSLELRIDWSEMDEFRHVNNVMFMKYVQAARVNYWQLTGIYDRFLSERKGPMVLSVECRFMRPLYFPGKVTIKTRTDYIRNTSFCFLHHLFDEQGVCVAEAKDILVMYDFNTETKLPFPIDLRRQIERLEHRSFSAPDDK